MGKTDTCRLAKGEEVELREVLEDMKEVESRKEEEDGRWFRPHMIGRPEVNSDISILGERTEALHIQRQQHCTCPASRGDTL